jgi:hypothetical protein
MKNREIEHVNSKSKCQQVTRYTYGNCEIHTELRDTHTEEVREVKLRLREATVAIRGATTKGRSCIARERKL